MRSNHFFPNDKISKIIEGVRSCDKHYDLLKYSKLIDELSDEEILSNLPTELVGCCPNCKSRNFRVRKVKLPKNRCMDCTHEFETPGMVLYYPVQKGTDSKIAIEIHRRFLQRVLEDRSQRIAYSIEVEPSKTDKIITKELDESIHFITEEFKADIGNKLNSLSNLAEMVLDDSTLSDILHSEASKGKTAIKHILEVMKSGKKEEREGVCPNCGSEAIGFADNRNECFTCKHEWE